MKKILLCILDGWGLGEKNKFNAIEKANTKNFDILKKKYSLTKLFASEKKVGLPVGQFGNSEVGHMNIGGGRIILQDILRIEKSFQNFKIEKNQDFLRMVKNCPTIHLCGILSDGGVHGHQDHLFKMIELFNRHKSNIFVHCFLDGRDTNPTSGYKNMKLLLDMIKNKQNVKIGSVCGRFYSMDRDNRWDRIQKAYRAIVDGKAKKVDNILDAIRESYDLKVTDEFFKPVNCGGYTGIKKNDGFFITNYRADRVRELLTSIFDENFDAFSRLNNKKLLYSLSMVEYSKRLKKYITPLLKPLKVTDSLGEILSKENLLQLRIAETEKYAHVTYFFNGGLEDSFVGEDRILVPSPRVETYDLKPEMSAKKLTSELINNINLGKYNFILTNFANPDMVGHTGNFDATVKAVEVVDECLGKLYIACKKNEVTLIITSDHGNADMMFDEKNGDPCTTHSINPVPFIVCEDIKLEPNGILADIAPSILELMGISKPKLMDGKSLIV